MGPAYLAHSCRFQRKLLQVARVESDFDSGPLDGGLGAVVECPQDNT
jgi:hypothetical protein